MPRSNALYVLVPAAIIAAAVVGVQIAAPYGGTEPVGDAASLSELQYRLPLSASEDIHNWEKNFDWIDYLSTVSDHSKKKLESNGFVVVEQSLQRGSMHRLYLILRLVDVPIIITADSVLHLYGVQVAQTLQDLESNRLYGDLEGMSKSMHARSLEQRASLADPRLKEAAARNAAYFAVGARLLDGAFLHGLPAPEADLAGAELDLVRAAAGPAASPLFGRHIDYSLFAPQGHYAEDGKMGRYFQAMAWYGTEFRPWPEPGRTDKDAALQAIQAAMISDLLLGSNDTRDAWERVYEVASFYAGRPGGLGPKEYAAAYSAASAGGYAGLLDGPSMGVLRGELARLAAPPALGAPPSCAGGGLGEAGSRCLGGPAAMRLMGQLPAPSPGVFPPLVGLEYEGSGEPLTLSISDGGAVRGLPRGLDVMYALGSERAGQILQESGDADYAGYAERAGALRAELAALSEEDRKRSLHHGWLHALSALFEEPPAKYPTFMQGGAWQDKRLSTALASWTMLRHDSVPHTRQLLSTYHESDTSPIPILPGYVEPELELYRRLHTLAEQMESKLQDLDLLSEGGSRITAVKSAMLRLISITEKELQNVPLTPQENAYVNNFFHYIASPEQNTGLNNLIDPYNKTIGSRDWVKGKSSQAIVYVHTDPNTDQTLAEATGTFELIITAYAHHDGYILAGVGPVYSYYEFRQPTNDMLAGDEWDEYVLDRDLEYPWNSHKLIDNKWDKSLPDLSLRPEWMSSFAGDRWLAPAAR